MPLNNLSDYLTVSAVDPEDPDQCIEKLLEALEPIGISYAGTLKDKPHFRYLCNYIFFDADGLKARAIVIEKSYTSLAYQGDYINYYAKCYHNYSKICKRVHFFSKSFDGDGFLHMIVKGDKSNLWRSYEGNIVIRPLSNGIIGASLLKTYKKKENRFFPGTRSYTINLFGQSLPIDSMPYQEQDGITGSCASAALWFAFQITSELFRTPIPSPSDITISAGYDRLHSGKIFPSRSLEVSQICKAIVANGLVAEARDKEAILEDNRGLKGMMYAYLRMGIPVLMGLQKKNDWPDGHEVTVNGFRFGDEEPDYSKSEMKLKLRSDKISKLYAHDDQIGPFAKLEFIENEEYQLRTSYWKDGSVNSEKILANPLHIILPIDQSIKIDFEQIVNAASIHSSLLTRSEDITWDIFLCESNKYKSEIRQAFIDNNKNSETSTYRLLFTSLPKYIWVAQAWLPEKGESKLIFDMIYDAVDVHLKPFLTTIYNTEFKETIKTKPALENLFDTKSNEESDLEKVFKETIILQRIENIYNEALRENPSLTVSQAIEYMTENNQEEFMNLAKQRLEKILITAMSKK